MTHSDEDRVRQASAAFGSGDLGALQSQFLAEDVVWHVPAVPRADGFGWSRSSLRSGRLRPIRQPARRRTVLWAGSPARCGENSATVSAQSCRRMGGISFLDAAPSAHHSCPTWNTN